MRIPIDWLNDYLSAPVDAQAVERTLTRIGLEVEGVERMAPGLETVVTGRIVSMDKHPNADRLRVCQTDVGRPELLQIVTGAPNVEAGDIIPVALVGSKLPGGLAINAAKLRGVESFGMYCSLKELGLPPGEDGVYVLPADTPIGAPIATVMGLGKAVVTVAVTANRPDALSIVGIARELAAAGLAELKPRQPPALPAEPGTAIVTLDDPSLCPRYAAQVMEGLTVGPSPEWLRDRLEAAGIRPISNVVDVTNYVLLELGQPLHAFDLTKIDPRSLRARRAKAGESIQTLDGEQRELSTEMLVIADAHGAQAIAGVMGGAGSQVTEQTTSVLVESAYFDPSSVRRTAKKLGLGSESSYRFERGVDPEATVQALARAVELIQKVAGGQPVGGPVDERREAFPGELRISFRPERSTKVLGVEVPGVAEILTRLGFAVDRGATPWSVRVPGWRRHDVTREVDLIEELARLHGYDQLPSTLPALDGVGGAGRLNELLSRAHQVLGGLGFREVVTPSLVSAGEAGVTLANPLADMMQLRTSLLPGLLEVAQRNHYSGNSSLALYEVGRTYGLTEEGSDEPLWIGLFAMGEVGRGVWKRAPELMQADFFWIKGAVENLAADLRLDIEAEAIEAPLLHPVRTARLSVGTETLGVLGELHPEVYGAYDLPPGGRAVAGWISVDALLRLVPQEPPRFRAFSRFPGIQRDVALVVSAETPASAVQDEVRGLGQGILESLRVFDRYSGPQVPAGAVSLGLSLTYRTPERTLTEEEVEPVHQAIVERITSRFGASIRDR